MLGIDVSHHQKKIDWAKVARAGYKFAFLKATQGISFLDDTLAYNREQAHANGLIVGLYHFAGNSDSLTESWTEEADWFLRNVGELREGELLVLDYELSALSSPADWCLLWLNKVEKATGVKPLLYTGSKQLVTYDWKLVSGNGNKLWAARYGLQEQTPNPKYKPAAGSFDEYIIWQFTSRGAVDGIEGFVDINTTELTPDELKALGAQSTTTDTNQPPSEPQEAKKPSQILNLKNWKLTLPEGKPTEITDLNGYSGKFFYVQGDGVVFRAPVNGATTSGSKYPRCELREMNGTDKASWSTGDEHSMYIEQAITHLPLKKKHVVAGQVHDANDDVLMIRLEDRKLFIEIDGKEGPVLDADYELGRRFNVKIESGYGMLRVNYNGALSYTLAGNLSGCYFKAGCYTQSNCDKEDNCSADNYGEVIIYHVFVKDIIYNEKPMFEKCPRCGYPDEPQEQENEEMKTPLAYFWQRNPRYKGIKLGNSNLSLQQYGCFTMCLAYMVDQDPLDVHEKLKQWGAYSGALIISDKAAAVLGLEYKGKDTNIDNEPQYSPSIKEVSLGKSQHFVVRLLDRAGKKSIYDPWTGEVKPIAHYPFRSYRLFKRK